ncbi:flagellar biosynthetic protein FliO [Opitutales bacterium]|jgi:flagellar biogenesis protein FliO|nr:flagellar biosynthetic protein FliO [Opitutales bacterium]
MNSPSIFAFVTLASLQNGDPNWLSLTLRSVGFLLLLAAIAYGVSKLGNSSGGNSLNGLKTKGKIVLSDSRPLGNRQFIVVAEYGSQKHLLGVSPGKIEHLAKLDDDLSDHSLAVSTISE